MIYLFLVVILILLIKKKIKGEKVLVVLCKYNVRNILKSFFKFIDK